MINFKYSTLLFVLICTLYSTCAQAHDRNYIGKLDQSQINAGSTIALADPLLTQGGAVSYTGSVALIYGREQRTDIAGSVWTYLVHYELIDIANGAVVQTGAVYLSNDDEEGVYEALAIHQQLGGNLQVEVTSVQSTGTIPADLRLELQLKVERYSFLADNATPAIIYHSTAKDDQTLLSWSYVSGAEYYELEWIYWDQQNSNTYPTEETVLFAQAVRAQTSDNHYTIDMVYPQGIVFFRVRPVGRFINNVGVDYSHLKYGAWSNAISGGNYVSTNFQNGHNWQFTRSFAEEGKHKEVINYFDDGLKSRQTLTTLNSEGTTIVAEQVYDVENRPSLSILPVPVDQRTKTNNPLAFGAGVSSQLITTGGISSYQRNHFDKSLGADPLPTNHISNEYYSSNNPFLNSGRIGIAHIASADNYPVAQMAYLNDATGRVRGQSGVGAFYQLAQGRATRYEYANASNTELKRLFGSNVGDAKHYRKNTVIDANGQQSISYVDQAGQTIATALIGAPPENVQELGGLPETLTHDLMGNNVTSVTNQTQTVRYLLMNDKKNNQVSLDYSLVEGGNIFCPIPQKQDQ